MLEPGSRYAPCSFAQQRLWFLHNLYPESNAYNLGLALEIKGTMCRASFQRALRRLLERQEALRTSFVAFDGQPVQRISEVITRLPLLEVDLTGLSESQQETQRLRWRNGETTRPFNLEEEGLFRACLLHVSEACHELVLALHHAVTDGWSMQILMQELSQFYAEEAQGAQLPAEALPLQYGDYAAWQRSWLEGEELDNQLAYWIQHLQGAAHLELPVDHPETIGSQPIGDWGTLFSRDLTERLEAFALEEGATKFMVALAGLYLMLMRATGQRDLSVGTPTAGRTRSELEGIIGFFANTLVLRVEIEPTMDFRGLVRAVRERVLEADEHQDAPFERIVEALAPERELDSTPLFRVLFTFDEGGGEEAADGAQRRVADLTMERLESDDREAKFDLNWGLDYTDDRLEVTVSYKSTLFEDATVQRMVRQYEGLMEEALASPEARLSELALLTPTQRLALLECAAGPPLPDRPFLPLHRALAAQARRTPERVALVAPDTHLTYAALAARARRLARALAARGVGPESRVGVLLPRRGDLVPTLVGVLEAGGAYVGLDAAYPAARLAWILSDASVEVVVTTAEQAGVLPAGAWTTLLVEDLLTEDILTDDSTTSASTTDDSEALVPVHPAQLAYLVYTSGSTGRPKGVALTHGAAAALQVWAAGTFPATGPVAGPVAAVTSVCFDLSVFELFTPLATGGCVVLLADALALATAPERHRVALVNTVPSAAEALLEGGGLPRSVRGVNLAGEALSQALVERLYAETEVVQVRDLYGPSEDTTYSTWAERTVGGRAQIGRPVWGTQAYVVDGSGGLVPSGVVGELYLGGASLARGYWGRARATAAAFVPDGLSGASGARLYRTGDRVRWEGRSLAYVGRGDGQVKVRGYRVELGEVERGLLGVSGVRSGAAVVRGSGRQAHLVGYVVAQTGVTLTEAGVREAMGESLPSYLVPTRIVVMEALPKTPNGKLDRRALPTPAAVAVAGRAPTAGL
ncbi:MAG: amino acid adenylation domain-containing protein, partial [Bacteroidota bacterium]